MTNVDKPATVYVLPLLPQLHQACACVGASYFELQYFIASHLSSGGHKIIPNSWSKLWHHPQTTVLSPPNALTGCGIQRSHKGCHAAKCY